MDAYAKERVESWAADFAGSDQVRSVPVALREHASAVLAAFLQAACEHRELAPDQLEQEDFKQALLTHVARLSLPAAARAALPALCGDFLEFLEQEGRVSDGRAIGAYLRALRPAYEDVAAEKPKPIVNRASKLGRNEPCPCGSGKKFKKCCMRE